MPDIGVAVAVFAVIFLAELPDKSLFASLVLGTRYRPLYVWAGVAAAFAVHVVIAVTAGQLLTLLPHRVVQAVVAALFLAGAGYLIAASFRAETADVGPESADAARQGARALSAPRVMAASFGMVFLAEWGDITQITIANLAARYSDPVSVAIGAVLGLWAISALAINAGAKILGRIPAAWVRRITGAILLGLGIFSAVGAITG